ncbi:hypothetical protein AVEN_65008-1 [Araneus ventricosus]|uniref:Uncharacterized protein n=1 Tax=Araneus ventricosus TaxID=182803 RepID=A0A4Y2M902_ARAVE|nr:hypothetical protein AVEN_65008-1 [Araneus ventricosus]
MGTSYQQGTGQAGGGAIMVWAVFTWHGRGLLIKLNQSLPGNGYAQHLRYQLQPFMISCTQRTMEFSRMKMRHVTGPKSVAIGLRKHSGQFQRMIWQPISAGMNRKVSSCTKSCPGSTFAIMDGYRGSLVEYFFKGFQTTCHVELLHFTRQKEVPHDITGYPMTFVSLLYTGCCCLKEVKNSEW